MQHTRELILTSRIESVDEAAVAGAEFAAGLGLGEDVLMAIDLAFRESVANAIKHGNRFDESKAVEVVFSSVDDAIEIEVRDFGTGFSVDDIPDPTDPENLLKANGRGILFMKTFMDEVNWSEPPGGGTAVKMTKKL